MSGGPLDGEEEDGCSTAASWRARACSSHWAPTTSTRTAPSSRTPPTSRGPSFTMQAKDLATGQVARPTRSPAPSWQYSSPLHHGFVHARIHAAVTMTEREAWGRPPHASDVYRYIKVPLVVRGRGPRRCVLVHPRAYQPERHLGPVQGVPPSGSPAPVRQMPLACAVGMSQGPTPWQT
jgi:hypothetical protein